MKLRADDSSRLPRLTLAQRDKAYGIVFILPTLVLLCLVILYPVIQNVWLSFHSQNFLDPAAGTHFVGLQNFIDLVTSGDFWQTVGNSLVLTLTSVAIEVGIGLPLAMLLNSGLRLQKLARTLFILPWATPTFVAAILWIWMLHPQHGTVNIFLESLGIGGGDITWLGSPSTAMISVIVAYVWKEIPWVILIFIAGLQAIDFSLREAARIDGAGKWREFWHVTLPGMSTVIQIVVVLRTIWTFNWFDYVYLLTGGGPLKSTYVLPLDVYQRGFVAFDFPAAAAVGVVMFILLTGGALSYFRLSAREDSL